MQAILISIHDAPVLHYGVFRCGNAPLVHAKGMASHVAMIMAAVMIAMVAWMVMRTAVYASEGQNFTSNTYDCRGGIQCNGAVSFGT